MSNINLIKELEEKMSIRLPVLTDSIQDRHFSNLLKAEERLYNDVKQILNDPNLNLEQKQKKLENLSPLSKRYNIDTDFSIPNRVKVLISEIDEYIIKVLDQEKDENLLPANIMKNFREDKPIKKQIITDKKKPVIEFLHTSLKLFELRENSFGLFLCSILIFLLRSRSQQSSNKKSEKKRNVIHLDFESDSYSIERITLVSTLGSQFREFIRGSKSLIENELLAEAFRKKHSNKKLNIVNKTLAITDKIKLIQETLKPKDANFYEFLVLDKQLEKILYIENEETGIIENELGIILLTFLEAVGLVLDEGKMFESQYKTYSVLKVPDRYISSIFKIPFSPSTLPLICEPKRWVKDNSNPKQNFGQGGFHFNEKENTQGVLGGKLTRGIVKITDSEIESLNYLQCNVYNVNRKFLNALKFNATEVLSLYMPGLENSNFSLPGSKNTLNIRDSESFIEADHEYMELKFQVSHGFHKKSTVQRLRRKRIYLLNEYSKYVNGLIDFIHFIYIATLFQNHNFYFVLYMDTRGRFYYSSARNSFGLQSNFMSKHVIELAGNTYHGPCTHEPFPEDEENDTITEKVTIPMLQQGVYGNYPILHAMKLYYGAGFSFFGVDASCSGTSIISGLIGYEEGIVKTNVICLKENIEKGSSYTRNCLYNDFLNHLKINMDRRENIFPESFIRKAAKTNNITIVRLEEILDMIFMEIPSKLLERAHVKHFLMCQNYAQQNQGRAKYIDEQFLNKHTLINLGSLGDHVTYKLRMAISFKIAQWIERNYKILYPELDEFCLLVRTKLSHKKPLTLCAGTGQAGEFKIEVREGKTIRSRKPDFNSSNRKKMNEISYFVTTDKINESRSARASVANFIHFLDSRLCSKVIHKCLKNKILIWTNHDCFYTDRRNIELVKLFYFESYLEILVESDTCCSFFNANELKKPDAINKFLKKTKRKRKEILEKIKTGEYVQNPDILVF